MSDKKQWIKLDNPPVIMAIFQIKFDIGEVSLSDYLKYDEKLRESLPLRNDSIHSNINMPATKPVIGTVIKVVGTQNSEITAHTFFTQDQKLKLQLESDGVLYIDEEKYLGWDHFIGKIKLYLDILEPILKDKVMRRISMRFINQFVFDEFEDPTEYFTTTISSTNENGFSFPISKYGFRMIMRNPNDNIHAIVNQNVETPVNNNFNYIFDIDVLAKTEHPYNIDFIESTMNDLREFKNEIFFQNLTTKTLEKCK